MRQRGDYNMDKVCLLVLRCGIHQSLSCAVCALRHCPACPLLIPGKAGQRGSGDSSPNLEGVAAALLEGLLDSRAPWLRKL